MKKTIHGTQIVAIPILFAPPATCPTSPSLGNVAVAAGCSVTVATVLPFSVAMEVPMTVASLISIHPFGEQLVPMGQQAPPIA